MGDIHQMDVKVAFLHGDNTKEIFMEQTLGFEKDTIDYTNHCMA